MFVNMEENNENRETEAAKLAAGLLVLYEPTLKKLNSQISEVMSKQISTLQKIETEQERLNETNDDTVQGMMVIVKDYEERLHRVKSQMSQITAKSANLKKRALRLQEMKQKEALQREHIREAQLTREQELIAKPSNIK